MPHTEELHCRGQSLEVSHIAEVADLNWNGESEEFYWIAAASLALPHLWQDASFMAQKTRGPQSGRGTCNSEFANSLLQGGSLSSQMCCRAFRAGHNPVAQLQRFEDLLTFGLFQNIMKRAIRRLRRRGFFHHMAGPEKFQARH